MNNNIITNNMIEDLRGKVKDILSEKRFIHTLGVENAALRMSELMSEDNRLKIQAAALLHDVTKEYSLEKQLKICEKFGIILRDDELDSPAVIHAITAAAIIPYEFPEFAYPEIISAVRWHTTGKPDMSISDKIIYLSDYIEDGRKYKVSADLRNSFWSCVSKSETYDEKLKCLDNAVLSALDNTVLFLSKENRIINTDTQKAIEYITNR